MAGAVVPVQPFVFEWQIDGCHTAHGFGLRLNGGVQLTVYREEWGLSAMVDPVDLRVAMQGFATTSIRRGGAALVNDNEMAEPKTLEGIERVAIKPHGRSPCC